MANFVIVWADSAKLEDSGITQALELLPKFSRIFKGSSIAQWKCRLYIIFFIDLDSFHLIVI